PPPGVACSFAARGRPGWRSSKSGRPWTGLHTPRPRPPSATPSPGAAVPDVCGRNPAPLLSLPVTPRRAAPACSAPLARRPPPPPLPQPPVIAPSRSAHRRQRLLRRPTTSLSRLLDLLVDALPQLRRQLPVIL